MRKWGSRKLFFPKRLFNSPIHHLESLQNILVGTSQYAQTVSIQKFCSLTILFLRVIGKVRIAIYLNHQLLFGIVKTYNVLPKRLLA